jgi:DNA-binding NarL/FixJ family response regulator
MTRPHDVLIVEDEPTVRDRLAAAVDAAPGFRVSATVGSLHAARTALGRRLPDLALVDLGLPDGDGCSLIEWLAVQHERVECLVLTLFADETHVLRAVRAGASGYLLKTEKQADIGDAMARVMAGESPISPAVAGHILRLARPASTAPAPTAEAPRLTPTELEVLGLIAKGFTKREIAQLTGRSVTTVPGHVRNIYRKLSVHNRSEAVYEAMHLGLLSRGER